MVPIKMRRSSKPAEKSGAGRYAGSALSLSSWSRGLVKMAHVKTMIVLLFHSLILHIPIVNIPPILS